MTASITRPDECPNVANHDYRKPRTGDYRKVRTYQCPDCGFFCLLAPASVVVTAVTPEGHRAAMKADNPPTGEDVRRLSALGAMPALAGAERTAAPGADVR